jgi:Flp pilus assembly protein TadG
MLNLFALGVFRRRWLEFRLATQGTAAVAFGISAVPLIAVTGAAIDYSHGNAVKAAFQSALDATALMLSKEAAIDTPAQLQANAPTYFKALFNKPEAGNISIGVTYTVNNGSQIVINGSATVPTRFMGMMGYEQLTITGSATAKWGTSRLRVALVLDNTGSMANYNKIGALKAATNTLLTQLQSSITNDGDVYVSIVPFAKDVNLDPSNYQADWIDWTDWNAANGTCSSTSYRSQTSCVSHGKVWTPADHSTWNGCVTDRGGPNAPDPANYDTNVLPPTAGTQPSLFSAEQHSSCPQAIIGLTTNWTAMSTLVNGMSPGGNTNQAIGLALGWMSLAGGGPFSVPAQDPNYTYIQAIVLLTDGLNTQDRWYSSQSSIDGRQQLTCNNAKAAGITIYTVQVNTDGDPTSTLLQNCASTPDNFFLLTSANQMVTAFNTIATNLTRLFVAQ